MSDERQETQYSHDWYLDYAVDHGVDPVWACTQCDFRMPWDKFDPDGDKVEELYRSTRDSAPAEKTDASTVRLFLSGFLACRGPVDPLGQALTTALLTSILSLPDDAIDAAIERGHEVRRAG